MTWSRPKNIVPGAGQALSRRTLGTAFAGLAFLSAMGRNGLAARNEPSTTSAAFGDKKFDPFLVFYGTKFEPSLDRYALLILEHSDAAKLLLARQPKSTFLCYLSLAEVHSGRPYYADLVQDGIIGKANPNWPDANFVDVRSPAWHRRVLDQLVPEIIETGYQGIFIDTLDSAEHQEVHDPLRCQGMIAAAAKLISSIRTRFPSLLIMINRGYGTIPRLVGQFDMLLGESVRTTFDSSRKAYRRVSAPDLQWQRGHMIEARRRNEKLQLFSLDYWDPSDIPGLSKIYAEERADGFIPYIATPDLTTIVPEP
jgi:uncharacterized protein (TIGR01370 family)